MEKINSFADAVQGPSREASSSVCFSPAAGGEDLSGIMRWKIGTGLPCEEFTVNINNTCDVLLSSVAKSDAHPDVLADLISEYLTDTILRIDSEASVDIQTVLKQDLILVTGEVGCSHPAKSAIVHSDQFLSTLNASIRDLLKDVLTPPVVPPSSIAPPPSSSSASSISPKKTSTASSATITGQPTSPNIATTDAESDDPAHVHIILAITPLLTESPLACIVSAKAHAGNESLNRTARKILQYISKVVASSGGIVVQVFSWNTSRTNHLIDLIDVSLGTGGGGDNAALVKELTEKVLLNKESLSPDVHDDTVVQLRFEQRAKLTARSSPYTGKDWRKPQRYAHVLAGLEATRLVHTNACAACDVELTVAPHLPVPNELKIIQVSLNTFPRSLDTEENLTRQLIDRVGAKTTNDIRQSLPSDVFFSRDCGGSLCSPECL